MKFEEHCEESIALFENSFVAVHHWLDEFAGKPGIGMKHRRFRHHEAGIKQVEEMWGKQAALAARRHILSDLQQEGWKTSDHLPQDEADYVRMGLF
jgi:hypothetical protein